MDSLYSDMKELEKETEQAHNIAKEQAEELSKDGLTKKISISELREQRTLVRNVARVPQYNKIDHLTGRTPMERFTLNAEGSIKDAMQLAEDVKEKFRDLLEYFGEDEKMASNDFFGTMKRFINAFKQAMEQVEKEEKQKVRACRNFPVKDDISSTLIYFSDEGREEAPSCREESSSEKKGGRSSRQEHGKRDNAPSQQNNSKAEIAPSARSAKTKPTATKSRGCYRRNVSCKRRQETRRRHNKFIKFSGAQVFSG